MELNPLDKKAAREIIEKGLDFEFSKGLATFKSVIEEWEMKSSENKAMYHKLLRKVLKHDKHIVQRYENTDSSEYLTVIAAQLVDEVIQKADLAPLSEEAKEKIERILQV